MLLLKTENGELLAELDKQRISLGRDPANEVVLTDPSVSGFHAVILNDRGVVSVVDVGSTNGTSLDGRRLAGRTELAAWTTLQLGAVRLAIEDSEGRAPTVVQPAVSGRRGADVAKTSLRRAASGDATRVTPAAGPGGGAGASAPGPGGERTEVFPVRERGVSPTVPTPASPSAGPARADRPVEPAAARGRITFEPLQPPASRPGNGGSASPGAAGAVPPVAAGGVGAGVPGAGAAPPPAAAVPPPAAAAGMPWGAESNDYALSGSYPRGLKWLLFSFKGRISRKTFWLTNLALFGVGIVVNGTLAAVAGGSALLAGVVDNPVAAVASLGLVSLFLVPWWVASSWIGLAITAKRLHDSGRRLLPWLICWFALVAVHMTLVILMPATVSGSGAMQVVSIVLGVIVILAYLGVFGFYLYVVGFVKSDEHVNEYGDPNPATMVVAFRW